MSAIIALKDWGQQAIALEVQAGGLAAKFHTIITKLMEEKDSGKSMTATEKVAVFDAAMTELAEHCQTEIDKHWPAGKTLSEVVPAYRNYKSTYRNGLKQGLDPRDYTSFGQFKNAKLGKPESGKPKGKADAPTNTGGNGGGSNVSNLPEPVKDFDTPLAEVPNNSLQHALKVLAELPEAEQKRIIDNFSGAVHAAKRNLIKTNPRMAGLAATGS